MIPVLGKSLELGAGMGLLGLARVLKTTDGSLLADLDLAGFVQAADEAKDDSGQPEAGGNLAVLLDVLELIGAGSINLEE